MSTELEMWLLFGYFVCLMYQTKKQQENKKTNKQTGHSPPPAWVWGG